MKTKKEKKAVVGYVRTATMPQVKKSDFVNDSLSAGTQEEQIKKYCKAKGYKLTKIFRDNGFPENNLKLPEVQELLAEVSTGKVSKVICLDLSRFSRRAIDFLVLKSLLKKQGVELITITGANTFNDSFSPFMEEMIAVIESLHSRISECRKSRSHKGK